MNNEIDKHDSTLFVLVMNLQNTAMIQLGKLKDPARDEMVRDLDGARFSIDLLEMLKAKCRENTHKEILNILDKGVMDLQLNYMDEMKKEKQKQTEKGEPAEGEAAAKTEAPAADPAAGGDPDAAPTGTATAGEED